MPSRRFFCSISFVSFWVISPWKLSSMQAIGSVMTHSLLNTGGQFAPLLCRTCQRCQQKHILLLWAFVRWCPSNELLQCGCLWRSTCNPSEPNIQWCVAWGLVKLHSKNLLVGKVIAILCFANQRQKGARRGERKALSLIQAWHQVWTKPGNSFTDPKLGLTWHCWLPIWQATQGCDGWKTEAPRLSLNAWQPCQHFVLVLTAASQLHNNLFTTKSHQQWWIHQCLFWTHDCKFFCKPFSSSDSAGQAPITFLPNTQCFFLSLWLIQRTQQTSCLSVEFTIGRKCRRTFNFLSRSSFPRWSQRQISSNRCPHRVHPARPFARLAAAEKLSKWQPLERCATK